MGSEKTFENKIKDFLKEQGCWFVKYWSGGAMNGKKFTKDGIPDILACVNGQFVGIEVKAKTGKPSPLQIYNLEKIDKANGFGLLLYPDDFDQFKNFIECLNEEIYDIALQEYKDMKGRWLKWQQVFKSQ